MFDSLFNKALKNGVDKGVFAQPKGPSGGTKLAKKKVEPKKPVAKKDTVKKPAAPKKSVTAPKTEKKATTAVTKKVAPKKPASATTAKKPAAAKVCFALQITRNSLKQFTDQFSDRLCPDQDKDGPRRQNNKACC